VSGQEPVTPEALAAEWTARAAEICANRPDLAAYSRAETYRDCAESVADLAVAWNALAAELATARQNAAYHESQVLTVAAERELISDALEAEKRLRLHRTGERDSARADRDRFAATLIAIRDDDSPGLAKAKRMAAGTLKGWPHEPLPHQLHICEEDAPGESWRPGEGGVMETAP
jgi:hypothetical protein